MKRNNQIILVKRREEKITLTMKDGKKDILEAEAFIGKNGLGKTKEGDKKTPIGEYEIGIAFGINENPRNKTSICENRRKYVLDR